MDASLVTSHRLVVSGLQPGATYHYRVRSVIASGAAGVSADNAFVTAPDGSGPELVGVSARRLTAATATLAWTTSSGNVAQVEYGATPGYGGFTLLKIFSGPDQKVVLTGLQPGSTYHYRVKAWDGAGYLNVSNDYTFTTAPSGPATLLGDQTIQSQRLSLSAGQAAGYQLTAARSGLASLVRVYLDAGTTANVIRVALYSDQAGAPGTILAQGSAAGLMSGWVSVSIPPVSLLQDQRYWVALLSPMAGGSLSLRDAGSSGGSSLLTRQTTLAAFPQTWAAGASSARSPLSVSVQQVAPAVTLSAPADGVIVTGSVALTAEVDDEAPVARLQFFVDGIPVGALLSAPPYSTTWDSRTFSASQPHIVTAQATDVLGRTALSGAVSVQVDNGPKISSVTASPGLTASSARVSWATDMLADGQVEFGPTALYGSTTPIDARAAWSHEMQLTGLRGRTAYHYRVRSRDANGALAVSNDATFVTPEP